MGSHCQNCDKPLTLREHTLGVCSDCQRLEFKDHINIDCHFYGGEAVFIQEEALRRGSYHGVKSEIIRQAVRELKQRTNGK